MNNIPTNVLVLIGGGMITALTLVFKTWFQRAIDKGFERMRSRDTEREEDNALMLRGLKVMAETDHELLYAVINGHHNGGLEQCQKDVDTFKHDVDDVLVKRAARRR